MPGIEISALPAAPSAQLTDVFPVDQLPGPITYKESNAQLFTLFKSNGEALTASNDTNVTLTLGGSPTTALLNPASLTLGWTGLLSPARGGTGVNNGTNTLTLGGNLTTSGAFNSTFTMTGVTNVTFPTSGTLATTGNTVSSLQGTANQVLVNGTSGSPQTGVLTLTTPQDIGLTSSPTFTGITLTNGTKSATPLNPTDIANKAYVDMIATGITVQGACFAGTTANLAGYVYNNGASGVGATLTAGSNGAFTTDGVSPALNARILVKNQSTTFQNGIYTLSTVGDGSNPAVLTRATDYNEPSEINPGDLVIITNGSTLTQSSWLESSTVTTIGTDPITWIQFTSALPLGIPFGGTGVTSVTTTPTASAWAGWNSNSNMSANNFIAGYNTTATTGGTTTLTVASAYQQYFTGTLAQTITMPVTSTLVLGQDWKIQNNSTQPMIIQSSGGNTIVQLMPFNSVIVTCVLTSGTDNLSWSYSVSLISGGFSQITPTFTFATPGNLSVVYGTRLGHVTRVGNIRFYTIHLAFTPTHTTSSGAAIVTASSMENANASSEIIIGSVVFSGGVVFTGNYVDTSLAGGSNAFNFIQTSASGSFSNLTTAAFPTGGTYTIIMSGFYFI